MFVCNGFCLFLDRFKCLVLSSVLTIETVETVEPVEPVETVETVD